MFKIWMLSQFYTDPLHSENLGADLPVCTAYGENFHCAQHPSEPDGWGLVQIFTSLQQIEAARQDPRVVVCGKEGDDPPAKLLEVFAAQLDPNKTYITFGQVLAKLAQSEPAYYHELE